MRQEAVGQFIISWKGSSAQVLGQFFKTYERINRIHMWRYLVLIGLRVQNRLHLSCPTFELVAVQAAFRSGKGVEALDLHALNGPVLVVDVPHESNITGALSTVANLFLLECVCNQAWKMYVWCKNGTLKWLTALGMLVGPLTYFQAHLAMLGFSHTHQALKSRRDLSVVND